MNKKSFFILLTFLVLLISLSAFSAVNSTSCDESVSHNGSSYSSSSCNDSYPDVDTVKTNSTGKSSTNYKSVKRDTGSSDSLDVSLSVPSRVDYGHRISSTVTVTDTPHVNGAISYYVDNHLLESRVAYSDDSVASYTFNTTSLPSGLHGISCIYYTHNDHIDENTFTYIISASDNRTTTVLKPTEITTSYDTSKLNTTINVNVTSTDRTSPNGLVRIICNRRIYSTHLLDNGSTTFNLRLPGGSQNIEVLYVGSSRYMPSSRTDKVVLPKENTILVTSLTKSITSNTSFTVYLRDSNKRNLKNSSVDLYENNRKLVTARITDGVGHVQLVQTPGYHKYTFKYNGNAYYNSSTLTRTVRIYKTATTINTHVIRNTPEAILKITLRGVDKQLVKTGTIQIIKNNKVILTRNTTGINQVQLNLNTGPQNITVKYLNNNLYHPTSKTQNINIQKYSTHINLAVKRTITCNTTFSITLKDQLNKAITTGKLDILDNKKVIQTLKITKNTVNTTLIQPAGDHKYTFRYTENKNYKQAQLTRNIHIYMTNSNTAIKVLRQTTTDTQLEITTRDVDKKVVKKGSIEVLDNNKKLQTGTLKNGQITIKTNMTFGKHNITVKYKLNNIYNPSTKTIKLQVTKTKTTPTITIQNNTMKNQKIRITVKDQFNRPVTQGTIKLIQDKKQITTAALKNGQITLNVKLKQKIPVTVWYNENRIYSSSTRTVNMTQPQFNTPDEIAAYYQLGYKKLNKGYQYTDSRHKTVITVNKNYTNTINTIKDAIETYTQAPDKLKQAPTTITFTQAPLKEKLIGTLGTTNPTQNSIEIYEDTQYNPVNKSGNLRAILYHEMGHALDNNVNNNYSTSNEYIITINRDYRYQYIHGYKKQLASKYADDEYKEVETLYENWAEAVAIVAQTKLEDKKSAILTNQYETDINYDEWKKIHPYLYNYTYNKIF